MSWKQVKNYFKSTRLIFSAKYIIFGNELLLKFASLLRWIVLRSRFLPGQLNNLGLCFGRTTCYSRNPCLAHFAAEFQSYVTSSMLIVPRQWLRAAFIGHRRLLLRARAWKLLSQLCSFLRDSLHVLGRMQSSATQFPMPAPARRIIADAFVPNK